MQSLMSLLPAMGLAGVGKLLEGLSSTPSRPWLEISKVEHTQAWQDLALLDELGPLLDWVCVFGGLGEFVQLSHAC